MIYLFSSLFDWFIHLAVYQLVKFIIHQINNLIINLLFFYLSLSQGTLTDTADQDGDKVRTYDHNRVEYSHLDSIFYVDSDELFYCPQVTENVFVQDILI